MNSSSCLPERVLVRTHPERCRMCYTCVRECPAKAIRISGGQAEIIQERCVGCGNCVRVCRQHAKEVADDLPELRELLASGRTIALMVAPSFPAEFNEVEQHGLVGRLRALGFCGVWEVGFGADLVARAYRDLLESDPDGGRIATTCPAVVGYVEKYHPDLVPRLAPIVSPMVAMARVIRELRPDAEAVVFAGPCVAKKAEALQSGEVEIALTFRELRELLATREVPANDSADEFDEPRGGMGGLFPVARGMLQTSGLSDDLVDGAVVAVDGHKQFIEALQAMEHGELELKLLEALSCNGCIMGAGISVDRPAFLRREAVGKATRERMRTCDTDELDSWLERFKGLTSGGFYQADDQRIDHPSETELREILDRLGKCRPEDELDCGACGYETCREHAIAIHKGLAEQEMCLPVTIERLRHSLSDLEESQDRLHAARQALINAEKLASMGQLSAGIAHEINNPLAVILLHSRLLAEEVPVGTEEHEDLEMIVEQAERCRKIVSGLLNFARRTRVSLDDQDVCELVRHGLKSIQLPETVQVELDLPAGGLVAQADGDQMIQVLTNLVKNAVEAMEAAGRISIRVFQQDSEVRIDVSDTGSGIPERHREHIFEPLFTTKQVGKGTGLGLAVSYGIVKMHQGRIEVESNTDPAQGATGSCFRICWPLQPGNGLSQQVVRVASHAAE